MEKVKPLPWETSIKQGNSEVEKSVNDSETKGPKRKEKKKRYQGYKEDPFVFLANDDPVWPEIR